jgi:hypothetical protein
MRSSAEPTVGEPDRSTWKRTGSRGLHKLSRATEMLDLQEDRVDEPDAAELAKSHFQLGSVSE